MWIVVSIIGFIFINILLYYLGKHILYDNGNPFKFWAAGSIIFYSFLLICLVIIIIIDKLIIILN